MDVWKCTITFLEALLWLYFMPGVSTLVFFLPPSNVGLRRLIYPGALQFYRGVNKLFYRRTVVVLLVYVAVYYVLFLAVMCVGRGEDEDDS